MLNGFKTYIVAGLIVLAALAHQAEAIDSELLVTLLIALGGIGTATLRHAVNK